MKQGTPLKRGKPMNRGTAQLKQKTPLARGSIDAKPKPAKGPKPKKCANKSCRAPYLPDPKQPFKNWCSDDCALAIALEKLAKQKSAKAKAERAEDRRRKDQGMTLKERMKATEKLVNRYVVLRDRDHGCISCHMPSHYDGIWHASHFKSVGSNSALRYNLWNIHKGCEQCNLFKAGNITEYEKRLVLKIGPERVEWLKHHARSRDYTAEYLLRLSAIMRRKIKRLEKRHAHG